MGWRVLSSAVSHTVQGLSSRRFVCFCRSHPMPDNFTRVPCAPVARLGWYFPLQFLIRPPLVLDWSGQRLWLDFCRSLGHDSLSFPLQHNYNHYHNTTTSPTTSTTRHRNRASPHSTPQHANHRNDCHDNSASTTSGRILQGLSMHSQRRSIRWKASTRLTQNTAQHNAVG